MGKSVSNIRIRSTEALVQCVPLQRQWASRILTSVSDLPSAIPNWLVKEAVLYNRNSSLDSHQQAETMELHWNLPYPFGIANTRNKDLIDTDEVAVFSEPANREAKERAISQLVFVMMGSMAIHKNQGC